MQVLLLAWEFPPRVLTAQGRQNARLARELTAAGHEVHVLTRHAVGRPEVETVAGITIHRVSECPPPMSSTDFVSWVLQFNFGLLRVGSELCKRRHFDVLHALGWQVAHTASALQALYELPVVAGLPSWRPRQGTAATPNQAIRYVRQTEWWLTYVARRVVVPDVHTRDEMRDSFALPPDKLDILSLEDGSRAERTVLFSGGAVYRDDATTMLAAAPKILAGGKDRHILLAGTGDAEPALRRRARSTRLGNRVRFRGWLSYGVPNAYGEADVVVVPSIAEPYGGVVLEALAARAPFVVGETDEMRELACDDPAGRSVPPGDPTALAAAVGELLDASTPATVGPAVPATAEQFTLLYARAAEEDRAALHGGVPRVPLRLVWDRSSAFPTAAEG